MSRAHGSLRGLSTLKELPEVQDDQDKGSGVFPVAADDTEEVVCGQDSRQTSETVQGC